MSTKQFSEMSEIEKSQTAVNLAILVLYDAKMEITAENINKILKAFNLKVESYWADIYAEALKGQNIESFFSVSSGVASSAPVATTSSAAPVAEKKQEKPKTVEEEEDMDMGGLFD